MWQSLVASSVAFVLTLAGTMQSVIGQTKTQPEMALRMLNLQSQQFEKGIIKVADNVYTAVGYHGANTSMIIGSDGLIIIDTLMGPASATNAFAALREYSNLPVKAIVYTHSHADHIGGASVFASEGEPIIYAAENFGSAEGTNEDVTTAKQQRGARQFGRDLSSGEQTNRGVAPSNTFDRDRGKGFIPPTVFVQSSGLRTTVAGVDIEFHIGPGETDDAIFIWLPQEKVLFAGDNFYRSFPNLYAIRGTTYRDVLRWSETVSMMAALKPSALVAGHTMPILGEEAASTALNDYSEAIRSVYDQTVEGINAGKGPDVLSHEVKLPKHLQDKPYLIQFYGSVPHSVRAIYSGLLGWYDGNPTTLSPLEPRLKAKKMAELAGGTIQLVERMNQALKDEDFQWALELSDYVKWLDDADVKLARKVKIAALRGLAAREFNAPNRNYYLSYANELESGQLSEIWF